MFQKWSIEKIPVALECTARKISLLHGSPTLIKDMRSAGKFLIFEDSNSPTQDIVILTKPEFPSSYCIKVLKEVWPNFPDNIPVFLRCSSDAGFFSDKPQLIFVRLNQDPSRLYIPTRRQHLDVFIAR